MDDCTDRPPPVMRGLRILAGVIFIAAIGAVIIAYRLLA